jgi:hypothetical protein
MTIPTIDALPTAPARTDPPATFVTRADAFVAALPVLVTQTNAATDEVDVVSAQVTADALTASNAAAAAAGAANMLGAWSALSGSLDMPASVSNGGSVWILQVNLANVAASEPASGNTDWFQLPVIPSQSGETGKFLTTDGSVISWGALGGFNSKSTNYTLVLGDAGKSIFHPSSDLSPKTFTIPSNASVAIDIGAIVLFVNEKGAGALTVGINTDILQSLEGETGSAFIAEAGVITALKITSTKWMWWSQSKTNSFPQWVAVAHTTSPFITAYPWSSGGFGAKLANPSTLPVTEGYGVAFSPSGSEIAVAAAGSPFIFAYPWSEAGFGAKFANPSTLPAGSVFGVAFSPAGTELVAGHSSSPFISAYPWSASGFGTKLSDPGTLGTDRNRSITFSPAGTEIICGQDATPYVLAYPWSASGFGTKFTNPATLPAGVGYGAAVSPAGTEVVIAHATTPFVTAYPWSASGFGAKLSDPSTLPAGTGRSAAFSPNGEFVAIGHNTSPFVSVYPWSASGFGAKVANPSTLPAGAAYGVTWSVDGKELLLGTTGSPYAEAYEWSASGFGSKLSNPTTLPSANAGGIAITS